MHIGWPQGILLGLLALQLLMVACQDGEYRTGRYNLSITILDVLVTVGLLYWGGFFG